MFRIKFSGADNRRLNFRLEDQLLTEQQLMLQASLLQYPHFGVFPGAAAAAGPAGLYPGLAASAAAGVHFPPADFYAAQSLAPSLLMSMKMPNASAANWLGLDRFDTLNHWSPPHLGVNYPHRVMGPYDLGNGLIFFFRLLF